MAEYEKKVRDILKKQMKQSGIKYHFKKNILMRYLIGEPVWER